MKKVLIIGENSYIGNSFKGYIENEINNLNSEQWIADKVGASDGQWESKDFTDYDCILHVAAIVHKKGKKYTEKLYNEINYDMAVAVAKKAKECHVGQFVFLSTMAVYDAKEERITKDTLANPSTAYGMSKLKAENEIIKFEDSNFKIAIIRAPMVYGEGCKGNYPILEKMAKYLFVFPEVHNKKSILNINKLVELIYEIIENKKYGYYYPADEKYFDICEFIVNIRKSKGKKTYLVRCFNKILLYLVERNLYLYKIFGSKYYEI